MGFLKKCRSYKFEIKIKIIQNIYKNKKLFKKPLNCKRKLLFLTANAKKRARYVIKISPANKINFKRFVFLTSLKDYNYFLLVKL